MLPHLIPTDRTIEGKSFWIVVFRSNDEGSESTVWFFGLLGTEGDVVGMALELVPNDLYTV
jgi:hypothetical protein